MFSRIGGGHQEKHVRERSMHNLTNCVINLRIEEKGCKVIQGCSFQPL